VVIDDAHLAGPAVADWVRFVQREPVPVAVVAATRPGEGEPLPAGAFIHLDVLGREAAAELVGPGRVDELYARSKGHPLFLTELAQQSAGAQLPASLVESVSARCDGLGRAGALLTLSYLGAVRSIPSYNVMGLAKASLEANVRFLAADLGPEGIRVNGISAGPIKTLAAAGIAGFRSMLARVAEVAPLRRNVTLEDVGNAAAFLCSDLAAGITGEILYVDSGFNTVGMSFPQEAEG